MAGNRGGYLIRNALFHFGCAALIICWTVVAHASCPAGDQLRSPAGLEVVGVSSPNEGAYQNIFGIYRLGLNGARIASPSESPDIVRVRNDVQLEPIWQTLVDWSVYKKPDEHVPHMRLYFSRLSDGTRQLCRMEWLDQTWEAHDSDLDRKLVVATVYSYFYNQNQQIEKVAVYTREEGSDKDRLVPENSICYRYSASGRPMAKYASSSSACQMPTLREVREMYVFSRDGELLRQITNLSASAETVVEIFDSEGQVVRRYEDGGRSGPRESAVDEEHKIFDGFLIDQKVVLPIGGERDAWRIVLARPEYARRVWYLALRQKDDSAAVEEVLATGISDRDGMLVPSSEAEKRVVSLVHQYPGRVFAQQGGSLYQLWPTIPKSLWAACVDPQKDRALDCQ